MIKVDPDKPLEGVRLAALQVTERLAPLRRRRRRVGQRCGAWQYLVAIFCHFSCRNFISPELHRAAYVSMSSPFGQAIKVHIEFW